MSMRLTVYLTIVTVIASLMVTTPRVNGALESAYILRLVVSTDSDWSTVTVSGLGKPLLWGHTVDRGPEGCVSVWADDALHLSVSKEAYDSKPVQASLEVLLLGSGDALSVEVEKGFLGVTGVRVYGWTSGRYMLLKRLSHGTVPGDAAFNRGVYTVSREALRFSRITVEKIGADPKPMVHAVYYPWYGTPEGPSSSWSHWSNVTPSDSAGSAHFPVLGAYDSLDAAIARAHIRMAVEAGLDGFLCSWWGPGTREDIALGLLLDEAERLGFTVGVYYESVRGGLDALTADDMADELSYLVERYAEEPGLLRVDGAPVVFVFGALAEGRDTATWSRVKELVGARVGEVLLVGDMRDPGLLGTLDGMHVYIELEECEHGAVTQVIAGSRWVLKETSLEAVKALVESDGGVTLHRKLTVGTVLPGYDDTEARNPGQVLQREGSETYEGYWGRVSGSDVDWVVVTSWNEWHEGTEVEPSVEDGFTALHVTRDRALHFKGQEPDVLGEPHLCAEIEPAGSDALVTLSNSGSGSAYAVSLNIARGDEDVSYTCVPCVLPGESEEFRLALPVAGAQYRLDVDYSGFSGSSVDESVLFTLTAVTETETRTTTPCTYPSTPQGEGVWLSLRSFTVQTGYGVIHVEAAADVLSQPTGVEYCSLDVLVDGEIAYGECWSSLPEVTWGHPGVTAPGAVGYAVDVPIEAGPHVVSLRGYARNTEQGSATLVGEPLTVTIPNKRVDVKITGFTVSELGGYLVVDVEAHVESEPTSLDYCSLTLLHCESVVGGVCWTDIEGVGGYDSVSAPVDLSYTWRVPTYMKEGLTAVVYARNTAQFSATSMDGYHR